jgi:hypothetical protein
MAAKINLNLRKKIRLKKILKAMILKKNNLDGRYLTQILKNRPLVIPIISRNHITLHGIERQDTAFSNMA